MGRALVKEGQISFGDIFSEGFFSRLYGDGELYVTYPEEYLLKSISSSPSQLDNSTQTLNWYRTQDFLAGGTNILLEARNAGSNNGFDLFIVAVLGSGGVGIVAIGFFIFKQRRRQKEELTKLNEFPSREVESDQEKILQLLKSSGGNLKQSEVCDKLRFSRAKTSLLLAEMEKNRLVRRCKKGKNKIVFRIDGKEGRNF